MMTQLHLTMFEYSIPLVTVVIEALITEIDNGRITCGHLL